MVKVSKTVSIELGLVNEVVKYESNFSRAVQEALRIWLEDKRDVKRVRR